MVDVINVDGDVANNNAEKIHTTAGELPSAEVIRQVDGNRTEPAASAFTQLLETRGTALGTSVEAIRTFIVSNAEALSNAVATLRDTDRMTGEAADKATALIDDALAAPAPSGSGGPGGSGSGSAAATRNAFGGR